MRFMVLCLPGAAPRAPARKQYALATPRVFPTLSGAEEYRKGIRPERRPITVAVVRPEDSDDVWYNQHGAEFLFLFEYEDATMGTCVWLLDEDGYEVGIPKASFSEHFQQAPECPDCGERGVPVRVLREKG